MLKEFQALFGTSKVCIDCWKNWRHPSGSVRGIQGATEFRYFLKRTDRLSRCTFVTEHLQDHTICSMRCSWSVALWMPLNRTGVFSSFSSLYRPCSFQILLGILSAISSYHRKTDAYFKSNSQNMVFFVERYVYKHSSNVGKCHFRYTVKFRSNTRK